MHSSAISVLHIKMPWIRLSQNQYYVARCYLPVLVALVGERIQLLNNVCSSFSYCVSCFTLLNSGCKIGRNNEFPGNWALKHKAHLCLRDRSLTDPIQRNSMLAMSYHSRNTPFYQMGFTFQLENKLLLKEQSFCFRRILHRAEPVWSPFKHEGSILISIKAA